MKDNKKCILLVDDEKKIVFALRDFFKAKGYAILEAYDGEQALEVFYDNNTDIDICILDIMMPKKDGLEVIQELREHDFDTPVIFLTAKGEEYDQINGFKYGADDYVSKPFSPTLLLLRVEAILKRSNKLKSEEIQMGNLLINTKKRIIMINQKEVALTRREFELLMYLVINNEISLTREQILNEVWGIAFDGNERTVDTHIKQLRIKLEECASYIRTIHCIGYKFEVNDEEKIDKK